MSTQDQDYVGLDFAVDTNPDTVQVRVSAAFMRQEFHGCDPDYIKDVCQGQCCRRSTSIALHPDEQHLLEAIGGVIKGGLLTQPADPQDREGTTADGKRGCQYQSGDTYLCTLHFTPNKPFSCIANPFTLNKKNTLIIRNRYRLLKCFKDDGQPAYKAFRGSIDFLFGDEEAQRICDHIESGGGDLVVPMPYQRWLWLKQLDDIRHERPLTKGP